MGIEANALIDRFGKAGERGNAAVFVGAGLSRGVGLPDWNELLEGPCSKANVPLGDDLPLVAEYILQTGVYSRDQLEKHVADRLLSVGATSGDAHRHLSRLPVDQIWTTNYDQLVESSIESAAVVLTDKDVAEIGAGRKCVIKMHGSLNGSSWATPPVITRRDYETYEQAHHRMWAFLRAAYLSRTILFLGFSFTDPNIEILLQLARSLGTSVHDRHMTVMRRPPVGSPERRGHELRVQDLEASGVQVHEIDSYSELDSLLQALVRRTRHSRLFVAGSGADVGSPAREVCDRLGDLAHRRPGWTLVSMAGQSGWHLSRRVAHHHRVDGTYRPQDFEFHHRESSRPPEQPTERLGTFYFHGKSREELVPALLDEVRAMVVIGGGDRTAEEAQWARVAGVGVVPIGCSGGTAENLWRQGSSFPPLLGGRVADIATWERLGNSDAAVAAAAALDLLDQAMYFHG